MGADVAAAAAAARLYVRTLLLQPALEQSPRSRPHVASSVLNRCYNQQFVLQPASETDRHTAPPSSRLRQYAMRNSSPK